MNNLLKLNGKLWIETSEGKLLGPGKVELLERIHQSGSLRQAALQMKMSYRQAWAMVNYMNSHFDTPLVASHRGGKGGGCALLTQQGLAAITRYHFLHKLFQEFLSHNSKIINL